MSEQNDKLNALIEEVKQVPGKHIILVEFHGQTCSLCKFVHSQLEPVIKSLPENIKERVKTFSMEVMSNPKDAIFYGINSIPTILLFVVEDGVQGEAIRYEKPISIPAIKKTIIEAFQ